MANHKYLLVLRCPRFLMGNLKWPLVLLRSCPRSVCHKNQTFFQNIVLTCFPGDGQPQAPTGVVSQIGDGQPQAPTGAPVQQISTPHKNVDFRFSNIFC